MTFGDWLKQTLDVPRWLRSGGYAAAGVVDTLASQSTIWFHVLVLAAFSVAGVVLKVSLSDWRWLALGWALVLAAEALNTGLEHLCDRVSVERDEFVRRAKDCGAGAVLTTAVGVWIANALTLWPYLAPRG